MKKTLITFAALAMASVAQADIFSDNLVVEEWNIGGDNYATSQPEASNGTVFSSTVNGATTFTMTMAINWETIASSANGEQLLEVSSYPTNTQWGTKWFYTCVKMGVTGEEGAEVLTLTLHVDANDMYEKGSVSFSRADYDVDGYLKLSYAFDGDQTVTFGALKDDVNGTVTTSTVTTGDSWKNNTALEGQGFDSYIIGKTQSEAWAEGFNGVEDMVIFNTYLTGDNLAAAINYVPEPTTATLSLLALAGLAARRRRK